MPDGQPPDDPIIRLEQVRRQKQVQAGRADHPNIPPEFSDDALALRFTDEHQDELRYVARWGKWMIWCGSYWKPEDTLKAFDLARAVCRGASAKAPSEKQAATIASAKTVNAVASLSRSDRRFAETVDVWDCDQWALNTTTGTIITRKRK
jgi:phage/plasmid-associated DNA primase